MAKCIFLVGLPGAGKSTWRQKQHGYVHVSSDDYIDWVAERNGMSYNDVFKDFIKDAEAFSMSQFEYAIKNNRDIIIDRTNLSRKSRAKFLSKLPKTYTKEAITFSISDEDHEINLNSRPGKNIPPHIVESMKNNYEGPSFEETNWDSLGTVHFRRN